MTLFPSKRQVQEATRLPGLDALRALAIIVVIIFHIQDHLPESFRIVGNYGWMGVDLFFVLSGFLIGSQLLKPYADGGKPSLLDFYRRRAFRILPAYFVVVLLYFTVPAWREQPGIQPLWQFLTFTENLLIQIERNHAFSHAWSLCVEEHFYFFLPLMLLVMMRRPSFARTIMLLAAIVGFGIVLRGYLLFHVLRHVQPDKVWQPYLERIYYPTYTHLDGLVVGVSVALMRVFRPAWWSAMALRGHSLFAASLAMIGAALWMFQDGQAVITGPGAFATVVGFPVLAIGLGLLVTSSVSSNGILSRFRVPGARLLATLAFSLYLTHKEIVHLDRSFLPRWTEEKNAFAVLVYAATCLLAAAILHVCVERPCMRLRDDKRRVPAGALEKQMRDEPAL